MFSHTSPFSIHPFLLPLSSIRIDKMQNPAKYIQYCGYIATIPQILFLLQIKLIFCVHYIHSAISFGECLHYCCLCCLMCVFVLHGESATAIVRDIFHLPEFISVCAVKFFYFHLEMSTVHLWAQTLKNETLKQILRWLFEISMLFICRLFRRSFYVPVFRHCLLLESFENSFGNVIVCDH